MTGKYVVVGLRAENSDRREITCLGIRGNRDDDHSKRRLLYLLQQNELSKPSGRGRVSDINRVRTAGSSRSFVQKNPDTILSHHDPFTPTSPPHLFSR